MRQSLPCLLVVLCLTTTTQAARVRMNWVDTPGNTIALAQGESTVIEIWIDLGGDDTLAHVSYHNLAAPGFRQLGTTLVPANWQDNSAHGPFDQSTQLVELAANNAQQDALAGPATYLLATQTIILDAGTVGTTVPFAFLNFPTLLDRYGAPFTWTPMVSGYSGYAGYVWYGDWGNYFPHYPCKHIECTRDSLYVEIVPEPMVIAPLALVALTLLRRRR